MKKINSLSDLLIEELADLLNAEEQLIKALPKMAEASQSSALRIVLEHHLEITTEQARRLKDIFNIIGQNYQGVTCHAMKGFITESDDVISRMEKSPDRDEAIINVGQRIEQYEIAKYKIAREHAVDLGHTKIVELLTQTLNEERAVNFHLNELAQYMINVRAINPSDSRPKTGGFYIPEGKFGRGGIKKKKNTDVSRFISEGNPNVQEPPDKEKEGQNPDEQ